MRYALRLQRAPDELQHGPDLLSTSLLRLRRSPPLFFSPVSCPLRRALGQMRQRTTYSHTDHRNHWGPQVTCHGRLLPVPAHRPLPILRDRRVCPDAEPLRDPLPLQALVHRFEDPQDLVLGRLPGRVAGDRVREGAGDDRPQQLRAGAQLPQGLLDAEGTGDLANGTDRRPGSRCGRSGRARCRAPGRGRRWSGPVRSAPSIGSARASRSEPSAWATGSQRPTIATACVAYAAGTAWRPARDRRPSRTGSAAVPGSCRTVRP